MVQLQYSKENSQSSEIKRPTTNHKHVKQTQQHTHTYRTQQEQHTTHINRTKSIQATL